MSDPKGPLPKLHERESIVRGAKIKLLEAISTWSQESDLTAWEEAILVQSVLGDHVLRIAKDAIRIERHGDSDKPGGWA